MPSQMPAAMAIGFFSAPAISVPITSVFVYTRNVDEFSRRCASSAASRSADATADDVGRPWTTSRARLGPDSTQRRRRLTPSSSASTVLIRLSVPLSSPLQADTTTASPAMSGDARRAFSRSELLGTANNTTGAPDSPAAQSAVTLSVSGNRWPGSRSAISRADSSPAASAGVRASKRTSIPRRAIISPSVTPHEVVPTTAAGPGCADEVMP